MWKTFFLTFWLVFVAELGDKTQLSTMLLASKSKNILPVFLGASLALTLACLIGTLIGKKISEYIPTKYINLGAGIGFIIIGLIIVVKKI